MTYSDYVALEGFISKKKNEIDEELNDISQERTKNDQTFEEKKKCQEQVEAKLNELDKLDYDFFIQSPFVAALLIAFGIVSSMAFVGFTVMFFQFVWPMGVASMALTGFFDYVFFFSKKGIARSLLESYKIKKQNPHLLEDLNQEKKDLQDYFETYYENLKKLENQKKSLEAKRSAWVEAQSELTHFFNDKTTLAMEKEIEPSMVEGKEPLQKK